MVENLVPLTETRIEYNPPRC